MGELKEILRGENIRTVFQPVITLANQKIAAYEAFSRGPKHSEFENPLTLFQVAREQNLTSELDALCVKKALDAARKLDPKLLLFINVEAGSAFNNVWQEIGSTNPAVFKRIVVELTYHIDTVTPSYLLTAIRYWQRAGLKVSLDGISTGCRPLQLITEAQPDFVKIDPSLVRDIDEHAEARELLKMLKVFVNSFGAILVAEGIETIGEFKVLKDIGITLGQGFLIKPPQHKPSRVISLISY